MKKKIKDLTLEECQRICEKSICKTCPLRHFAHNDEDNDLDCPACYEATYILKEVDLDED